MEDRNNRGRFRNQYSGAKLIVRMVMSLLQRTLTKNGAVVEIVKPVGEFSDAKRRSK